MKGFLFTHLPSTILVFPLDGGLVPKPVRGLGHHLRHGLRLARAPFAGLDAKFHLNQFVNYALLCLLCLLTAPCLSLVVKLVAGKILAAVVTDLDHCAKLD